MTIDEDRAIQLCLRDRDPRGFEFLVEMYRREAFYHAVTLLGNRDDAADACQESFTRAFMAFAGLASLDRFYPWFYRILRNHCLNVLSRRKTATDFSRQGSDAAMPSPAADPSALVEQDEEQQLVWRLLQELSPEQREILAMKYFHGLRYEEISNLLEIPRGTVMSRLYAARKAFRSLHERHTHATATGASS
jgi:RNA polymerase sigma-70 factor, ECF subfamily